MTDADVFAAFRPEVSAQTPLRAAITAAYRRPEPECVPPLLATAGAHPDEATRIEALARNLVASLRAKTRSSGVEGLIHEYSLSSQEGVALMCLAEALLRIPDAGTRDALIRDKLAPGDWRAHLGHSPSLFVNDSRERLFPLFVTVTCAPTTIFPWRSMTLPLIVPLGN